MKPLGIAFALALSACATPQAATRAGEQPALVLEDYFQGRTYAIGLFEGPRGDVRAKFHVTIDGAWDGKVLTLDENFLYSDGRKDRRVWTFEKTADGYVGKAGDVIGTAPVAMGGDAALFGYLVDLAVGEGRTIKLRFRDRMYLYDGGLMLNRATVTKYGVLVGEVTVSFQRSKPEGFPAF
jgi:hypothetical protein